MEDDISDDIYGDLGDFECNEKIKDIANLTERLNQSVVTITDLQKEIKLLKKRNRDLAKNSSSLLMTAKLELGRKQRDKTKQEPTLCEGSTPTSCETLNKCNDPSKYRIPKKNPFARHENNIETRKECIGNGVDEYSHDQRRFHLPKKNPNARCLDAENDKLNVVHVPQSDRKDIDEKRSIQWYRRDETNDKESRRRSPNTHISRRHRDYKKCNSHQDDQKRDSRKDDRKHTRGRSSSSEIGRHSKCHRSDSSSNHHRSRSRPSRNAEKGPKTKSPKKNQMKASKDDRRHEEAQLKMESVFDQKQNDLSDLKKKDLEAMLIAHKKILHDISKDEATTKVDLKENESKEHRKRKTSNVDDESANKSENQVKIEGCNSANNDVDVAVSSEFNNTAEVLTIDTVAINQSNSTACDRSIENIEPPINSKQDSPLKRVVEPTSNDVKPFVPFREFFSSSNVQINSTNVKVETEADAGHEKDFKSTDDILKTNVAVDQPNANENSPESLEVLPMSAINSREEVTLFSPRKEFFSSTKEPQELSSVNVESKKPPKTNCIQNNDNSNSRMDLDYELMERTSGENCPHISCEEENRQSSTEDASTPISPIVNRNFITKTLPTQINASFIAMEKSNEEVVPTAENVLENSYERHIQTKSSEYTVQDVGHEIRIFLTKKRKKNKSTKVAS